METMSVYTAKSYGEHSTAYKMKEKINTDLFSMFDQKKESGFLRRHNIASKSMGVLFCFFLPVGILWTTFHGCDNGVKPP